MKLGWLRRPPRAPARALAVAILILLSTGVAQGQGGESFYTVTVTVTGPGEVDIAPDRGPCDGICSLNVAPSTVITLSVTSESLAEFSGWEGACTGSDDTCTVVASSDRDVEAVFEDESTPPSPPPPNPFPPAFVPQSQGGTTALLREVDRVLAGLPTGTIVFTTPATLEVGETTEIVLVLSLQKSIEELEEELSDLGEREGARVRITDEMEARLIGRGFAIEPIDPARQAVSRLQDTIWRWEVEPTRGGVLRLHLTLSGFLDLKGSRRERTIRSFDRTLTISVRWHDRVLGFLGNNLEWLWTGVLIPLVLLAFRYGPRRAPKPLEREQKEQEPDRRHKGG